MALPGTMSQRFTVTAFSRSDGERAVADIQGEVNQLFEGDEPTPISTDKGGASSHCEDALKGRMRRKTPVDGQTPP